MAKPGYGALLQVVKLTVTRHPHYFAIVCLTTPVLNGALKVRAQRLGFMLEAVKFSISQAQVLHNVVDLVLCADSFVSLALVSVVAWAMRTLLPAFV